jgi:menaquinone-dependent protoporphyrinogen oxidase
MTDKLISRRSFLKAGYITAAAAGITIGGVALATSNPELPAIEFPSFSFGEKNMKKRLLLVYASATGSTIEIAEKIGKTLAAGGWAVDVHPVQKKPQLTGYQAVLMGSAVQYSDWLPEAIDYAKENQVALSKLPVGLFCVHIRNIEDDELSRKAREAYLDKVRMLVKPVCEGYFAGRFNTHGAMLLMPKFIARFIPAMDMRNWNKIQAWAEEIQPALAAF